LAYLHKAIAIKNLLSSNDRGSNQKRLNAISKLEAAMSDLISNISTTNDDAISEFKEKLDEIRKEILADHKANGALRILGKFQLKSRLFKLISEINVVKVKNKM
jgi:hypothetical protein